MSDTETATETATETVTETATLARVRPGVDCTAIAATTYDASKSKRGFDPYAWTRVIGPGCVKEAGLDWFMEPRSMVEALRLAYGDKWRIDLLPAGDAGSGLFLLTHHWTGWRLLARLGVTAYAADPVSVPSAPRPTAEDVSPVGEWCSHPTAPRGNDLRDDDRYATSTAVRRRGWLARAVRDSTVATEDLRKMLQSVGIRPEVPRTEGDGLDSTRLLCDALVEVWLAEHGYTGDDAAAIRTMVALRGLDALDAYARSTATRAVPR